MKLGRTKSSPETVPRHQSMMGGLAVAWLASLLCLPICRIGAAPVEFKVDPASSAITQSGSITFFGFTMPFVEQGPGSLTTHYAGTMLVNLTPPSLQFPGGSVIAALTNGVWPPAPGGAAGSAPAEVAGKISISLGILGSGTGLSAGRNMKLDLASQPLTLRNSCLDSSRINVSFITNIPPAPTMDFRLTGTGLVTSTNGFIPLAGTFTNGPAQACLTNTAGLLELTIPVNVTNVFSLMSPNDTTMILRGQIVATAPSSAWSFPLTMDTGDGQVTLTWPSVAGQSFIVEASTNLHDWTQAFGNTVVDGNLTTWSTSLSSTPQLYRVELQ